MYGREGKAAAVPTAYIAYEYRTMYEDCQGKAVCCRYGGVSGSGSGMELHFIARLAEGTCEDQAVRQGATI